MKVLQSVMRWFKAKDAKMAEAIEKENEVAFAEQDLDGMRKDFTQVSNNVGEVKASIAGLKRDLLEKKRQTENLESDARALLDKNKESLAVQLCAQIETLEQESQVYESSIAQQENMLKTLEKKRNELKAAVGQAESSLRMMQTMDSVTRASEKISSVRVGNTTSALSRFKNREKRLQSRLDKATAMNEMSVEDSGGGLKNEVDEALGRGQGSSVLARLKKG